MATEIDQVTKLLDVIQSTLNTPFWNHLDFWIVTVVGLASVGFSLMAFVEARNAKRAATEAGKSVKIQTVTIELTEISQKLDKLQPGIHFNEVRDLLTEITRRLRRIISPFQNDSDLSSAIKSLKETLTSAKGSLNKVRPADQANEKDAPNAVYYGIEGEFASISDGVADLLGLFEKKTINFGDDDGDA